jgi:hypothetical protein
MPERDYIGMGHFNDPAHPNMTTNRSNTMSLTRSQRELMDAREGELNDAERAVIDVTFDALYDAAKARGVKLAKDDRAAALEAAMVQFILASK